MLDFNSPRSVIPPPGCPAVFAGGVADLRTAHFRLDIHESDWEQTPEGPLGPVTELDIAAVFARHPGDLENVVESGSVLVPVDDPLVEKAAELQGDPERLEALRRVLCNAVLSCPGIRWDSEERIWVCGALTSAVMRDFLESLD